MRFLPFAKGKKGFQFAGGGVSDSGGGGGGYVLPVASSETLGGIKVGNGLTITGAGVLSASGGSGGGGITVTDVETKVGTYAGADLYCKKIHMSDNAFEYSDNVSVHTDLHIKFALLGCTTQSVISGETHSSYYTFPCVVSPSTTGYAQFYRLGPSVSTSAGFVSNSGYAYIFYTKS